MAARLAIPALAGLLVVIGLDISSPWPWPWDPSPWPWPWP